MCLNIWNQEGLRDLTCSLQICSPPSRKGSHTSSFSINQTSCPPPGLQPNGFHFPASLQNYSHKPITWKMGITPLSDYCQRLPPIASTGSLPAPVQLPGDPLWLVVSRDFRSHRTQWWVHWVFFFFFFVSYISDLKLKKVATWKCNGYRKRKAPKKACFL